MEGAKRQASIEFGVRLATALMAHARAEGPKEGADPQTAILGATDYLNRYTGRGASRRSILRPSIPTIGRTRPRRASGAARSCRGG
jgi:hypothetical protein